MSGAWGRGSTRAWRKVRLAVLRRDGYRCQLLIDGVCTTIADCVHHLRGKAHGDSPRDLVASCTPCNLHVGDPLNAGKAPADPAPRPSTTW
jgi:5-methylcytosine-specific restriction endonuclease McrA